MKDPAVTAQRQQARQQGLLVGLITLPFRFVGVLGGSLLLSILIECVGLHLFWPDQGWRHAQEMLSYELEQLPRHFARSVLVQEPGQTAQRIVGTAYDLLFVRSGLVEWVEDAARRARGEHLRAEPDFPRYLRQAYWVLESYLLAGAYTVLVFLVRLLVLFLSLPLFAMAAFVGLVDGLVRRDIRRFEAGRESGFLYHRAKACVMPLAVLPWVVYLALPISVAPVLILLPAACLLGLTVNLTTATFKKHL
ncbi:TIGR03747 family integrating conjugative element membrane protein [Pseudomonas fluorescens]|uniref:TIGR03747 family integrating conjugative element membrane protein n=1 Tax=Pseudomonas fluorescens TaxID=294 RepID=UPI001BEC7F2D|nr:TIGR03747 family integrating conjugative element membrane protein [Pseudomonas fluorescens]MBT2375324.1 TIGR03747 family integrating conjugative element membrane protein [Pseudomonas fluorescens]